MIRSSNWLLSKAPILRTVNSGRMLSSKTDFGYKEVEVDAKERLVREVFSRVADKYDVMNDFMSMGTHRLWKDELISMMGIPAAAHAAPEYIPRHLDVAGGTGDVAFRSLKQLTSCYGDVISQRREEPTAPLPETERQVVVFDINPEMLEVGRKRSTTQIKPEQTNMLGFVEGNAEDLPFPDNSFDLYTIAFGLRNVTNKDKAIKEAHRVLKRGGRMLIMEFSHVTNPIIGQIYDQFSFKVIPKLGAVVANDAASYQYLVESIRRFPKQEELLDMMHQQGFQYGSYRNFTFGVVAVHSGFKL